MSAERETELGLYCRFLGLATQKQLLVKSSNIVTWLHFRLTPNNATEDTLREVILEQIRLLQRRLSMREHDIWLKMVGIGEKLELDFELTEEEQEALRSERLYEPATEETHPSDSKEFI